MSWTTLEQCPFMSSFIAIDGTIIAVTYTGWQKGNGIYRYDQRKNKWIISMLYPRFFMSEYHPLAYDEAKQTLYLYSKNTPLNKVNLKMKRFTVLDDIYDHRLHSFSGASSAYINSEYYLFGGTSNNSVLKLDDVTGFKQIHNFKNWDTGNGYHGLIYVKYQQKIYLFGGSSSELFTFDDIWCYSLITNSWKLLDVKLPQPLSHFGYCYIENSNTILIFGGCKRAGDWSDDILIWNINSMLFYKSKINCPGFNQRYHAVITANKEANPEINLIVFGYLRSHSISLPIDICKAIEMWCKVDDVHLFATRVPVEHWKINIFDILQH